ncbi:FecR family protein [Mucilaginibacter auburnensis]|uniref:Ferric-dicitrate binding protein FerR (Iron transport regulator) n=1 Tax=Mucilaginibacter auburnensis TaxID=1457233 RepID=A0A2H9VW78_9SPHI|nr:FecR domain-containing protein [Mucilaginibacter auburnensis]PJJ85075.1 ferric-dicitrate binding protein FerR (iron transport regulator) [Mucilaginibacter auburnensis]
MKNYDEYSFQDFLDDDSFIALAKHGPAPERAHWEQWLATQPENATLYRDALNFLQIVNSAKPVIDSDSNTKLVWRQINHQLSVVQKRATRVKRLRVWSAMAASVILLLGGAWWYLNSIVVITTGNGEQQLVKLPDDSEIQLNANSSLSYHRAWAIQSMREVWLNGEALFKVNHLNKDANSIKASERFVAHAANVQISVLGTEFNVKNRRDRVVISLVKGKISVSNTKKSKSIIMLPGDALQIKNDQFVRLPINQLANKPLAWTQHKIMASGLTVADIIENYEDTYGGQIIVDNPSVKAKRIDGIISLQNKENTLYMLANLLNATIEQRNDSTFYFRSNNTKH